MDHIRDYFYYKDPLHAESEINLNIRSDRLENWGDHSVYKNRDGEIIPEILRAMMAIRRYKIANGYPVSGMPLGSGSGGGGKWEYDL